MYKYSFLFSNQTTSQAIIYKCSSYMSKYEPDKLDKSYEFQAY